MDAQRLMDKWQERRILILGTTYPSHSHKYNETVCTGGIEEESGRMVRLHPVPMRYLDPSHRFKKFQWIRARLAKHDSDPRPESYRVDFNSITPEEIVQDHETRRSFLERSPHLISSLEELKEKQQRDGTSLGIIRPRDILDCYIQQRSASEREEWMRKEQLRLSQEPLFGERPKPLDFPEAEFAVRWACNNDQCPTHTMHILQWGLHELYRKLKANGDPDYERKVIEKMQSELDEGNRDVFLFLGNFRTVMYNFGLMDSYSPPKRRNEQDLFTLFRI
jgi:hypothetical protein